MHCAFPHEIAERLPPGPAPTGSVPPSATTAPSMRSCASELPASVLVEPPPSPSGAPIVRLLPDVPPQAIARVNVVASRAETPESKEETPDGRIGGTPFVGRPKNIRRHEHGGRWLRGAGSLDFVSADHGADRLTSGMGTPTIVVILVAAGAADSTAAIEMTRSAEEALDPGTLVTVREGLPVTDGQAVNLATSLHADSVVTITWQADGRSAHLHVYSTRVAAWKDRDISFGADDAEKERGSTIGFAIAAMVPRHPAESTPPSEVRAAPLPTPAVPHVDVQGTKDARPEIADQREPEQGPSPTSSAHHGRIDLLGNTGAALGGGGFGLGAELGVCWEVSSAFCLRMGGGYWSYLRNDVSLSLAQAKAGLGWDLLRKDGRRPLVLGLRGDAVASLQNASGMRANGTRWMPSIAVAANAAWYVTTSLALVAEIGTDVSFGTTAVYLGADRATTFPNVRIFSGLGGRVQF